jgi:hypothetical protein
LTKDVAGSAAVAGAEPSPAGQSFSTNSSGAAAAAPNQLAKLASTAARRAAGARPRYAGAFCEKKVASKPGPGGETSYASCTPGAPGARTSESRSGASAPNAEF